jgi:hypothetical protein
MNAARKLLLLLCVTIVLAQGCVAPATGGLRQVAGEEAVVYVGVYAGLAAISVAAFTVCGVVDLFSLPFAIQGELEYFYVTRNFFDLCF